VKAADEGKLLYFLTGAGSHSMPRMVIFAVRRMLLAEDRLGVAYETVGQFFGIIRV
jgi:hypothetical protein